MSSRTGKKDGSGDKHTVTLVVDQKKVQSTEQSKVKAACGRTVKADKDTKAPVVDQQRKVKAECRCTVNAPAGQTQTVDCKTHGSQTVAKKYERKKGAKKDSS